MRGELLNSDRFAFQFYLSQLVDQGPVVCVVLSIAKLELFDLILAELRQ